jgi:drug/metabolite transporter (DMT)-like permease
MAAPRQDLEQASAHSVPDARLVARKRVEGHIALVAVQFCFGLFPVFGVIALRPGGFSPLSIAAWRMLFGAATLLVVAFALHGRRALPSWRDMGWLLIGSLLGVTLNMVLYLEGLARSTPTNAALIMSLIPVFTFAIAVIVGQERVARLRVLGIVIALVGVSSRFWAERPELAQGHALGNLLMVGNAACYSGYFVVTRPLLARLPPIVVTAWVFALSVPFVPIFAHGETLVPATAMATHWKALAFILLFPTLMAYVLNTIALARLSASTAAIYVYLQPLITATASVVILGEVMTPAMLFAGALVFAGIWLVSRPQRAALQRAT